MAYLNYPSQDNRVLHQLHCIVPTYLDKKVVQNGIRRVLKKFGRTSALLSFIRRRKYNCITKEQFDEMYKTNQESEERIDLSVGDELETFTGSIKSGVIEKELFSGGEDYKHTFLLCLLDEK